MSGVFVAPETGWYHVVGNKFVILSKEEMVARNISITELNKNSQYSENPEVLPSRIHDEDLCVSPSDSLFTTKVKEKMEIEIDDPHPEVNDFKVIKID